MDRLALGIAALVALLLPGTGGPIAPPAPRAVASRDAPFAHVRFIGDDPAALGQAEAALRRVFATPIGRELRDWIDAGALGAPLAIEVNRRGDNFTHYRGRELDARIAFDPTHRPPVPTEHGLLPAWPETVLAHELGHAVWKLVDEEAVIRAVENPLRAQLGLPRRSRF